MCEDYYRFTRQPFSLTPDPEFLFKSTSHQAALDQLLRGIWRGEGFLLLTGDVGTSKTTVCRTLVEQLGKRVFTALVSNPFVTQDELLRVLLLDFGVVSRAEARTSSFTLATQQQLLDTLNEFLLSLVGVGATAAVIVDEAQNLSPQLLEGIRLLSNLETDNRKLLQLLLVGQPELVATLEDDGMRQLRQRIARRLELTPLSRDEVGQYIAYRLRLASGERGVVFNDGAIDLVYEFSGGVPRKSTLSAIGPSRRGSKRFRRALTRTSSSRLRRCSISTARRLPRRRRPATCRSGRQPSGGASGRPYGGRPWPPVSRSVSGSASAARNGSAGWSVVIRRRGRVRRSVRPCHRSSSRASSATTAPRRRRDVRRPRRILS